ncbi:hypothetical protein C1645_742533 [Glomus cerebriforme]|uniref:Galactose oxidase n=1 Tax=Glomus cerebriforme TaxID=658196 RepID=A0A397SDU2_9GLOM|nr:hypothetical protein C1645_742533 [Glomus cerebriforme]
MSHKSLTYMILWILFQLLVEINCQMTPFKPMPRIVHTATVIDNKLYILGGSNVKGSTVGKDFFYLDVSVRFNTQNLSWQDLSIINSVPLHTSAASARGGTNNNTLFLYGGGWGGAELSLNQVYMYDIINDSWNIKATSGKIPSNRDGFSAVLGLDGQRVIIFGGFGYDQLIESDILLLDISNNVEYIWTYNFAPLIILPTSSSAVATTSVIQSSTIATSSTNSSTLPQQSSSTPMIVVILGSLLGGTLFSFGCFFLYKWNKNKQKQKDVIHYDIYNQDMTSAERNIHNYEQEINNNNQEIIIIPRNENTTNHEPIIPAPVINNNYNHRQEGFPITNNERYSSQDLNNLKNMFKQEIQNLKQEILQSNGQTSVSNVIRNNNNFNN